MDAKDALTIQEIVSKAERYKSKYQSKEDGGTLHYIWEQDELSEMRSIDMLPDNLYRMAKLAGKPE